MKITAFAKFSAQFEKSFKDNPLVIHSVLANIFSMRIIGNKTHGDLAEIALTEYINQFVDGFSARHTGKEKFRAKEFEEDVRVKDLQSGEEIPISVKTYGSGPLQLSTNKDSSMFTYLRKAVGDGEVKDSREIKKILGQQCFTDFSGVNVLPLIYNERAMAFKVIVFGLIKAYTSVRHIKFLPRRESLVRIDKHFRYTNFMMPRAIIFLKSDTAMQKPTHFNVVCGRIPKMPQNTLRNF